MDVSINRWWDVRDTNEERGAGLDHYLIDVRYNPEEYKWAPTTDAPLVVPITYPSGPHEDNQYPDISPTSTYATVDETSASGVPAPSITDPLKRLLCCAAQRGINLLVWFASAGDVDNEYADLPSGMILPSYMCA